MNSTATPLLNHWYSGYLATDIKLLCEQCHTNIWAEKHIVDSSQTEDAFVSTLLTLRGSTEQHRAKIYDVYRSESRFLYT